MLLFNATVLALGNAILFRIFVLSCSMEACAVAMSTAKPFSSTFIGKACSRFDLQRRPRSGKMRLSAPARPSVITCASWRESVAATSSKKFLESRSSTSVWNVEEIRRNPSSTTMELTSCDFSLHMLRWNLASKSLNTNQLTSHYITFKYNCFTLFNNTTSRSDCDSWCDSAQCHDLSARLRWTLQNSTRFEKMVWHSNPRPTILRSKAASPCRKMSCGDCRR